MPGTHPSIRQATRGESSSWRRWVSKTDDHLVREFALSANAIRSESAGGVLWDGAATA